MRVKSMKSEALVCRAMAKKYAGRPEEPFLLKVASTFEELALVAHAEAADQSTLLRTGSGRRINRGPGHSDLVTSVKIALNQGLAAAIRRPGLALCWAFGHNRSLAVAFETGGVWHSLCHRCGHPLRRQSAGRWGEITRGELARARSDAFSGPAKCSRSESTRDVEGARPPARRKKARSIKNKLPGDSGSPLQSR